MKPTFRAKLIDPQTLARLADWLAVGVAVSLPWSTSATGILIVLWLVAVLPAIKPASIRRELATAAGGLPVLLWLLGAVGMLWADVTWSERFGGLDGFCRLLAIPLLLAQFRRSERGAFVLYGFLAAAAGVLAVSWALVLIPGLRHRGNYYGVPVKDYVFQSEVFLTCAFALIAAACRYWRERKARLVYALIGLAGLFLADIAFVNTGRTALLVAPFLVIALGWRVLGWKGALVGCAIAGALAGTLWVSSSYLRERTLNSVDDLRAYIESNAANPTGQHVEFLRKSIEIVSDAPVVGHGTGSIAEQFRRTAAAGTGADAIATVNPHNQIFAVAIQLGLLGAIVLVAMWTAHFMLFRGGGLTAWIGMIVVIQNVISSAVNSHLFDFSQGWLYVFGVGVAGGMALRERDSTRLLK